MITAKLYIPEAHAEVGGMNWFAMQQDKDFSQAVRLIVEERCFSSGSFSKNKIYCPAS